jgi:hypothetical protein
MPKLGEVASQGVDCRGALSDQQIARPVDDQHALLLFALERNEPHPGPLHRLTACFGIRCVVLVGLHVGPDITRRH